MAKRPSHISLDNVICKLDRHYRNRDYAKFNSTYSHFYPRLTNSQQLALARSVLTRYRHNQILTSAIKTHTTHS